MAGRVPLNPTRRVALCAAAAALQACAAPAPAASDAPVQPRRVADGVYVLPGRPGAADAGNLGRIGNTGFIVGPQGVLAIDTGTSFAHGRAMLAAIASVTAVPLRLALVTHTRPEFLFGGAAFQAAGVPVAMHAKTARLMAARCDTCLKQLQKSVGEAPMRATTMYKPDREFHATHDLPGLGRRVRVLYFGESSGPGDIAVHDLDGGVLFCGGLVDAMRIPDIQDADLPGWHRALAALGALGARVVVPGHGPVGGGEAITGVERYLAQLEARARTLVDNGTSLLDVQQGSALAPFAHWDQYDTIHRRNASIAYLRVEREQLLRQ